MGINSTGGPKLNELLGKQMPEFDKSFGIDLKPQGPTPAPNGAPDGVTTRSSASTDMAPQQRSNLGALSQLVPYNGMPPNGPGGGGGGNGPNGTEGLANNLSTMFQNMGNKTDQAKDLGGSIMEKQMQTLFDQSQKQMEFQLVSAAVQGVKDMTTAVAKTIKGVGSGVKDMIN